MQCEKKLTFFLNSVCHVNRYYKTPRFLSEFLGYNSGAADHFWKCKGFSKKCKGKMSPTWSLQERGTLTFLGGKMG
jgi:hypothetical protein